MPRYLPTLRGWIAFVLAAFAILYFPVLRPALIVESGRGTFVAEPVPPIVWITGAFLIIVCLLASVEAFRRGSRADKVFACISVLLTIGLAVQYFELAVLSVYKSPCAAANPAIASRLQANVLVGRVAELVRPLDAVNTLIELHDSKVAEIGKRDGTVSVHFLPAYLHKSEGRPGLDSGTGWVQEARLIFADATASGDFPDLPCDVMDGELVVGAERHGNEIPVPLVVTAHTKLRLVFDSVHTVRVTGGGVRLELLGEPRYVEDFKP